MVYIYRFHSIAYLQQIWWLQVEGDIEFKFPAGSYSLFFLIKLERPSNGWRHSSITKIKHRVTSL